MADHARGHVQRLTRPAYGQASVQPHPSCLREGREGGGRVPPRQSRDGAGARHCRKRLRRAWALGRLAVMHPALPHVPDPCSPVRVAGSRAPLSRRAAKLPRPADARYDEAVDGRRHPEHCQQGRLGPHPRLFQEDLRRSQPVAARERGDRYQ